MRKVGPLLKSYRWIIGTCLLVPLLLYVIYIQAGVVPQLQKVIHKVTQQTYTGIGYTVASSTLPISVDTEILHNFAPWQPLESPYPQVHHPFINHPEHQFKTLAAAVNSLKAGDTLYIPAGVYYQGFAITQPNVSVIGLGKVIFDNAAIQGKGAIITQANNTLIRNIECRGIRVPDLNGACVRHEANNLTLEHVYFHASQEGLLSGEVSGHVKIFDSRFENLDIPGSRAHGIYIGSGTLEIENSVFLASLSQGHEIKSRAASTVIRHSVIASLSATDSRLIDIPNGGRLQIEHSVLQQGINSANAELIGYGLEFRSYKDNKVQLTNNIILMEQSGINILFNGHKALPRPNIRNNKILTTYSVGLSDTNTLFSHRENMGLAPYPMLPLKSVIKP